MNTLQRFLATGLLLLLGVTLPAIASAKTIKKKHHTVHTTATTAQPTAGPKKVTAKVGSHIKSAGHKVSYNTWRVLHPHKAKAEAPAERAADNAREAADKKREAEYHATHK